MSRLSPLVGFILCLLLAALPARAEPEPAASLAFARTDDGGVAAALALTIPSGSHVYAHEPGDTGRPAEFLLTLEEPGGFSEPVEVRYPAGAQQRDYYDRDASVNVYQGKALFALRLPPDSPGLPYVARLSLLLCTRSSCTPLDREFSGRVPQELPPLSEMPWRDGWLTLAAGGSQAPDAPGPRPRTRPLPQGAEAPLPAPDGFNFVLTPVFADQSVEIFGLSKAILLGLLAGLLLNVMPCVLPVLTLKMSALLFSGRRDAASLALFRSRNLWFAAGILTLFTLLACFLGALDLMWGQLYQSQEFLLVLLVLVFLLGLSMLNVFTLPVLDIRAGAESKNPRLQAFSAGLFATFLATPCSGPLLGGVLGWAFAQPLPLLVLVFWSVGLGMATPYLLLCLWPRLGLLLPRPGPWMRFFERILGFLLLATALYLLSILPDSKHLPVLAALLATAAAAWLWGQFCGLSAPPLRRRLGGILFAAVVAGASFLALQTSPQPLTWTRYTAEDFAARLGRDPMVVEFTADWCPNCKFVEATVLTDRRLRDLEKRFGAVLIRVDLTGANAAGSKLLDMLGSRSIPLTALFPAGEASRRPLVLRDVFTGSSFDRAAEEAFSLKSGTQGGQGS